jgi:transposase
MNKEQKYTGVDISKDYLDIAVAGSTDKWRFGNNQTGIKKAIKEFKKKSPVMVVFESTGGLEIDFWLALNEAGIDAAPINPRQIRNFAQALNQQAKTDTIDAQVIAQFGQVIKPKPQVVPDTQGFDLPPSNEASYNIVKRGTKNAEERLYTGTDYQQTQRS